LIRPKHLPILSILRLSVPELCVTQSDHITITWNGHCACAVWRDLSPGAKMIHILKSLTQIYLFTLSLLGRYDVVSAMSYAKNSIYPIA